MFHSITYTRIENSNKMPGISFLPHESITTENKTSITATVHDDDSEENRFSGLESVRRSRQSQISNDTYNASLDDVYSHHSRDPSMDKRLVMVLFTVGSLALFFMFVVGALIPDDGEFGSKGGESSVSTSTTSESDSVIHNRNFHIVPLPPEDIERLCEDEFISKPHGYAICKQACKFSECCMLNSEVEGSCLYGDNRKICALYQDSCGKVYQEPENETKIVKNITSNDESELANICSNEHLSTDEGKAKCYDACKPAMCCFQSSNTSNSCQNSETKFWCDMFSACSKISFVGHQNLRQRGIFNETTEVNSITSISQESVESPKKLCDQSYVSEFGINKCEESCESGHCCFDNSTYCSNDSFDCSVYDPCLIIYGTK